MHDDPRERQRVASNIGAVVLAFCRERLRQGGRFHMHDLNEYVQANHPSAPASADRILRQLRAEGKVAYEVLSRSESLYRLQGLGARGEVSGPGNDQSQKATPVRPHVGGGPGGLFDGAECGNRRGIDAVKGR